jgi:hypothetical protein
MSLLGKRVTALLRYSEFSIGEVRGSRPNALARMSMADVDGASEPCGAR